MHKQAAISLKHKHLHRQGGIHMNNRIWAWTQCINAKYNLETAFPLLSGQLVLMLTLPENGKVFTTEFITFGCSFVLNREHVSL